MKERVLNVMAAVLDVPVGTLNEDSSPDNVEQWDSLHHMNLVLGLEQEFGIQFTEDEIIEMLNAALIIAILQERGIA